MYTVKDALLGIVADATRTFTSMMQFLIVNENYCRTGYFHGFQQNRENIMSANTILIIFLLRKYSKL